MLVDLGRDLCLKRSRLDGVLRAERTDLFAPTASRSPRDSFAESVGADLWVLMGARCRKSQVQHPIVSLGRVEALDLADVLCCSSP